MRAAHAMGKHLAESGLNVSVFTTDIDGSDRLNVPTTESVEIDGMTVRYFPVRAPRALTYSPALGRAMRSAVESFDLVHIHSVLNYPATVAARACRDASVPYLIRPCGILDRSAFTKPYESGPRAWWSRLRKSLYMRLVSAKNVRHASALHFTTRAEQLASKWIAGNTPGVVVPLGTEIPKALNREVAREAAASQLDLPAGIPWILFLSRIHPVKGLERLLHAVRRLRIEARLIVAGRGTSSYERKIDKLTRELELSNRVSRVGFVTGATKTNLLAGSDLFVLPSHHENFGVAVIEALAHGLPVLLSPQVGVQAAVVNGGAGCVAEPAPHKIAESMAELLGHPERRRRMSARARHLARTLYGWDRIARDLIDVYEGLLKGTVRQNTLPV